MNTKSNHNSNIALLIPAHNEELVLLDTIMGAKAAGIDPVDIFVVDDSSDDNTFELARLALGATNVLHVERSGKARALRQAIDHFELEQRYQWLQIIDADSFFSPDYFDQIKQYFAPDVAAICGQVRSLRRNWITSYRAYEYTVFQDFYKTLQNKFGLVTVMPGPATCFNTKILKDLQFSNDTLTEDFDMTLQIHRNRLGRIVYVAKAHSWTQDPPTLPIYIRQITRWYQGYFQVIKKHRIGSRLRPIDLLLLLLTLDGIFYCIQLLIMAGIFLLGQNHVALSTLIATDFVTIGVLALYAAIRMRRVDVLAPLPYFYILRLVCVGLFIWAAVKILCLPKSIKGGSWNTGRVAHKLTLTQTALKGGVA
jgi:cellulose synthase/poly-beta-1,6-N-acetylglucosamine synthase-like glycosyltransferase